MIPRFALLAVAVSLLESTGIATHCVSPLAAELPSEAPLPGSSLDSHGAASPPELFTVYLEHAPAKTALVVEPHADGMVALYEVDGSLEYVPLYRIRRIQDSSGVERTKDVVLRGRRLGPPRMSRARAPEAWRRFRLRAGPGTVCGSYLITDFEMMWRAGDHGHASDEEQLYASIDYGYARNIGRSQSLGGSAFLGVDGARAQAGLRLHARRWITPDLNFGLAPGIILAADEEGRSRFLGPGFAGQADVSLGGRFGITGQVFSIRRDSGRGEVRETAWHAGFRLGAEPGIAATPVFLFYGMVTLMNSPRRIYRTEF